MTDTLLRKLRHERGFFLKEIAARIAVSIPTVSRYETRTSTVGKKQQEKLSKIFDKRKDELFDEKNMARSAPEE